MRSTAFRVFRAGDKVDDRDKETMGLRKHGLMLRKPVPEELVGGSRLAGGP
jgi:hypothetical protein